MEVRTEHYAYSPFNGENRDIRDVYIYKGDDEKVLKYLKKEKDGCKEERNVLKKVKRRYKRRRKE